MIGTAERLQMIRVIGKMEKNPEFSEKLDIKNKSWFTSEKGHKRREDPYETYRY